jgi:hypothetical protein
MSIKAPVVKSKKAVNKRPIVASGMSEAHASGISEAHASGMSEAHASGMSEAHASGMSEAHASGIIDILSQAFQEKVVIESPPKKQAKIIADPIEEVSNDPIFFPIEEAKMSFEDILEPYKMRDSVPAGHIQKILKAAFPSVIELHSFTSYHRVIKIRIHDLLNAVCIRWENNRPADQGRCEDIAEYIKKTQKPIDTTIYLSLSHKKKLFEIIDGIHRYTALCIIKQMTDQMDLLTSTSIDDMNWLYQSYIIINVRINQSKQDIREVFNTLNKSVPIPDLYEKDTTKFKQDLIELVAARWQKEYKSQFVSTNKPVRPNININRFMDLLSEIYDKYDITEDTHDLLDHLLRVTNKKIADDPPINNKITQKMYDKCAGVGTGKIGCWLFLYTVEELINLI